LPLPDALGHAANRHCTFFGLVMSRWFARHQGSSFILPASSFSSRQSCCGVLRGILGSCRYWAHDISPELIVRSPPPSILPRAYPCTALSGGPEAQIPNSAAGGVTQIGLPTITRYRAGKRWDTTTVNVRYVPVFPAGIGTGLHRLLIGRQDRERIVSAHSRRREQR
jgi:hypothetical protein